MANTFILIAQQPLECRGQSYQPGERFVAHWSESAPLIRKKLAIEAPSEEQRAHGAQQPMIVDALHAHTTPDVINQMDAAPAPRRRGRPRKVLADGETPRTYRRRDLEAEK